MDDIYIVDLGSRIIKFGKAGDEKPSLTIPHIYAKNGSFGLDATASGDELRYGNQRKANLEIGFDAADIGILIDNLQALSGPNFSEKPTLFGVNSGIGKPYLKKFIECFFEKTGSPAIHLFPNTSALLIASGKTTGFCLDIGDVFTSAAAIFEGRVLAKGTIPNLGGRDVTNYLGELLDNQSLNQESNKQEILYKIKEEHCFCALPNFEAASQRKDKIDGLCVSANFGNYGQQISLSTERFTAPEILFKPNLLGKDINGVQYLVSDVISEAHISTRKAMLNNFILGGGTTLLTGFKDRLKFELDFLNEEIFSSVQNDSPSNCDASFYGCSIAAKQTAGNFLSKKVFDEKGCSSYLDSLRI